jgi:hypothetical protein
LPNKRYWLKESKNSIQQAQIHGPQGENFKALLLLWRMLLKYFEGLTYLARTVHLVKGTMSPDCWGSKSIQIFHLFWTYFEAVLNTFKLLYFGSWKISDSRRLFLIGC